MKRRKQSGSLIPTPELVLKAMGYKRVQNMGGNLMIIVPRMWLRLNAYKTNEHYWVKITSEKNGSLILKPVDKEEVIAMMEANKCQV